MKILLGFYGSRGNCGDAVIREGIFRLMPQIKKHYTNYYYYTKKVHSDVLSLEEVEEWNPDYYIKLGTPSWFDVRDLDIYDYCMRNKKHFSIIGVGMGDAWEGWNLNKLKEIVNSGLLDFVSVRDSQSYDFFKEAGYNNPYLIVCPGFFFFSSNAISYVTAKKNVILDIIDPVFLKYPSCHNSQNKYYERMSYIYNCLLNFGANVQLITHRYDWKKTNMQSISSSYFNGALIRDILSIIDFQDTYIEHDFYIGARVHGGLPSAGRGCGVIFLGVDRRQNVYNNIPSGLINKIDISSGEWDEENVLSIYNNSLIESQSKLSIAFRREEEKKYKKLLEQIPI